MKSFPTTIPGYPRVGPRRIYKSLLEKFWSGAISEADFDAGITELKTERLRTQAEAGLDWIPCGDFSLYDHVLDTAITFGCLPSRLKGLSGHAATLAAARGQDGLAPQEMTKWFDTNYHYLVPELPDRFELSENRPLEAFRFAKGVLGDRARPVLLGPFTFLRLARLTGAELARRLKELIPLYAEVLASLTSEGAMQITLDETALVTDLEAGDFDAFLQAYRALHAPVILQTAYGDVAPVWPALRDLPVTGFGLDFVRGRTRNLRALHDHGFPTGKLLVAGVVDGRNVWRTDLDDALALIREIEAVVETGRIVLSSSCSLLHLPETVTVETALPAALKDGLCFAQERLGELSLLSEAARNGVATDTVKEQWGKAQAALSRWRQDTARLIPAVRARVAELTEADAVRLPYVERVPLQRRRLKLPLLPTTTIGSFPQTPALRKARAIRRTCCAGVSDNGAYEKAIRDEIAYVVRLQEEIGLDVLVHGEPERNDMVQFFGDQMRGFATTDEGWVQSYGSRCVRPPVLYGDIERLGPMTVDEVAYAQSLTAKPVKGMLTGPITILQWSFVRDDIPKSEVAYQIALAIRDEAADLERAGIDIIQIDEAAYREGLPLRRADWSDYIAWAVRAFRIASSGVRPETQIHTHMCYSDFGDMIEAISAMDADVISIEDARSDGALLEALRRFDYPQAIGPGVYDIHSPNVPTAQFVEDRLRANLTVLAPERLWVNPDCGLKTRRYEEVLPALRNMVEAAQKVRSQATPAEL